MNWFYIGFEGPIGAGKTTLAGLLAARIGCELLLEDFDGNDFLADFYADRPRWSLPMQLSFLASRHKQLADIPFSCKGPLVADYTYAKDKVFAHLLLQGREWHLYERIEEGLSAQSVHPNLVVYLDAGTDVLLDRIKRRNRAYEEHIDAKYLDDLRSAYETYYLSKPHVKLFPYNTSKLDLSSETQMNHLFDSIIAALPSVN